MTQFNVYVHEDGRVEAVKVGLSYPAFFFGWIWALLKKMWKVGGIVLAIQIVLRSITYFWVDTGPTTSLKIIAIYVIVFLAICLMVVLLIKGNEWAEESLKARGFVFKKQVAASDKKSATMKVERHRNQASTLA